MAKEKAGTGKCPICGDKVVWRRGEKSASLSATCQECGYQGYAPAGTEAERDLSKSFFAGAKVAPAGGDGGAPSAAPEGAPIAKPEAEAKPAPAKVKKTGLFGGVYP